MKAFTISTSTATASTPWCSPTAAAPTRRPPATRRSPITPRAPRARRDFERIDDWSVAKEVRPGAFAHNAYDFTAPRKNLLARSSAPKGHALAGLEVFDFQGDYTETLRRGRLCTHPPGGEPGRARDRAGSQATPAAWPAARLFTLTDHPRSDQNREYLIVSASYRLQSDDYGSVDSSPAGPVFQCNLSAMDAQVPYRPPRVTPKPVVQGPQTAIVVGKSGEEIWTDKYGRVKVQFHWDRYAKADENSSCWVRVAQVWAGKGWGGMMIPRIGQEVIVDFLEGDPDQPIITGRVYNGDCMPPYTPAGQGDHGGAQEQLQQGRRRLQRDPLRGQEGLGAGLHPRRKEPGRAGQERHTSSGSATSVT